MSDPGIPVFTDDTDWDQAQETLISAALSDGLPMVPPTETRLSAMLGSIADPTNGLGMLPPLFGTVTAEAIAYQAVLAGAPVGVLPVLIAATKALQSPTFNLLGVATTTGSAALALSVHGPIAEDLAMNSGTNCLGPGNQVNATIGRALSLILRNIGGAKEGSGDMATMGQPGKYGFCFAEQRHSWIPSFSERQGRGGTDSAVTVFGASGSAEILPDRDSDHPELILNPIVRAIATATGLAGQPRPGGHHLILLPPEMADLMEKHGWRWHQARDYITAQVLLLNRELSDPENIHIMVTGGPGVKMTYLPLWAGGSIPACEPILDGS